MKWVVAENVTRGPQRTGQVAERIQWIFQVVLVESVGFIEMKSIVGVLRNFRKLRRFSVMSSEVSKEVNGSSQIAVGWRNDWR